MPAHAALAPFQPLVASWFAEEVGEPTPVQVMAWERIAAGSHVLATAPTGSGKTLAAFLWAIDRLIAGEAPLGVTSVVYVSPLKALNSDVQRNLLGPLEALRARAERAGRTLPEIRALTRSGDTPASERARMLRRPPEILITTPESLNLMLTSASGRAALGSVRTVILDEIHAVAGGKRGVWLMAGIERLRLVAGEFQRIALSATVRPLELVAELVGGRQADGRPRPVEILRAPGRRRPQITVHRVPDADAGDPDEFWPRLARDLKQLTAANRSTLLFCNSRRMSEKLARFLNEGEAQPIAWAHHGSLSREMRRMVEERLKAGELKALVATSSLELGIDIGALDEVVLVQCPRSLNACIQRIGRAGHHVGGTPKGRIVPLHGRDLLEAAVVAPLAAAGECEPLVPVDNPLDVLAQLVVAMCAAEPWAPDRLLSEVRRVHAWRELTREAFDLVVAMLLGRWGEARVRELLPRLRLDRDEDGVERLHARPGAGLAAQLSGGVIPDRGYFTVRVQGGGARLGELDEEFVWERHAGDEFAIGTQVWRIARITHDEVEVVPGSRTGAMSPFWRAEAEDRPWDLSRRIGEFLERTETGWSDAPGTRALGSPPAPDPALAARLARESLMEPGAADELAAWLARQRESTGALPHRHLLIAERVPDPSVPHQRLLVLHAHWGGRALRPLAMALSQAWRERFGTEPEVLATDDCLMLPVPEDLPAREVLALVPPERLDRLLRARLPSTGFFGARFRENAARALLLPRTGPRGRTPLWLTRLRAKKLLEALTPWPDFPIVLETWRSCLEDAFDLDALRALLGELADGVIALREVETAFASPFAEGVVWTATNARMYDDDAPATPAPGPSEAALAHVLRDPELRPRLPPPVVAELEAKLARTHPGWAPSSADELVDAVTDRVLLPLDAWRTLLDAAVRDGAERQALIDGLRGRALEIVVPGGGTAVVAAVALPRLLRVWRATPDQVAPAGIGGRAAPIADEPAGEEDSDEAATQVVAELLRGYGPRPRAWVAATLGLEPARAERLLDELVESGELADRVLVGDADEPLVCDAENLERLLRLARAARRSRQEPLPAARLPLFLATWQHVAARGEGPEALERALARLIGRDAPAAAWESEILPARVRGYQPAWLDHLLQTSGLMWIGQGRQRIAFVPRGAEALVQPPAEPDASIDALLPDRDARYDLLTLAKRSGVTTAELTSRLWDLAWRGRVANDAFASVRQGITARFAAAPMTRDAPARAGFAGWRATRPLHGAWHRVDADAAADGLDELERDKERVRLLAERHGVLFRELLAHEPAILGWGRLMPAMRLLELSGELLAGAFIAGVSGLQFASPEAARRLAEPLPDQAVWWLAAADPASCCGLKLPGLETLPSRAAGTRVVFVGADPALVSRRGGKALDFHVPMDHPALGDCLALLREWLAAPGAGPRSLAVETIDGQPAIGSRWAPLLQAAGFHRELKALTLRRAW